MENKRYTNCWPYWMLVAAAWLLLALAMSGCRSSRHSVTTKAESAVTEDSVAEVKACVGFEVFTADSTEVVFTADSVVTPRGVAYNPKVSVRAKQPRKGKREESVELSASHSVDSVSAKETAITNENRTPATPLPLPIPFLLFLALVVYIFLFKSNHPRQ